MESVLKYIYTGKNILTKSNVLTVYQAANFLQISSLITLCEEFLITGLSVENCLGIWKMSKLLERFDLAEVAKVVILQNFTHLLTVEAFEAADLDSSDLKTLLNDPFLNSTPSAKCKATIIWLLLIEEGDTEKTTVYELFHFLISTCGVTIKDIKAVLDQEGFWNELSGDNNLRKRKNTYIEILRQLSMEMPAEWSAKVQERIDEAFVVIGGNPMKSKTFVMALNLRDQKWYSLVPLPEDPGFQFAICSNGASLYLSGGSKRKNTFLCNDINETAWYRLPDLPFGKEGHGMCCVNGAIYTFGGNNRDSDAVEVQMYKTTDMSWKKVGEIAKPVNSSSHCVLDSRIYIFGGSTINSTSPSDCAQCYDTRDNISWYLQYKLPFRSKSSTLSAVAGTSLIYLVYKGSIYSLDPEAKATKVHTISSGPRNGSGSTSYGDKVLIIGGEDESFRILDKVFLFDPSSNQSMALISKAPWPLLSFHYTTMKIPSAFVHGLKMVDPSDGSVLAIGY